jgi:hypothetical protein
MTMPEAHMKANVNTAISGRNVLVHWLRAEAKSEDLDERDGAEGMVLEPKHTRVTERTWMIRKSYLVPIQIPSDSMKRVSNYHKVHPSWLIELSFSPPSSFREALEASMPPRSRCTGSGNPASHTGGVRGCRRLFWMIVEATPSYLGGTDALEKDDSALVVC